MVGRIKAVAVSEPHRSDAVHALLYSAVLVLPYLFVYWALECRNSALRRIH